MTNGPDRKELARELYERKDEAVVVPFIEKEHDGWKPQANECHRNADLWSLAMGGCVPVRGWAVFDYNEMSGGLIRTVRFFAHSVLEADDGTLFDITPSAASQRYPFLTHHGSEEDFQALVEDSKLISIDYDV